MRDYFLNEIDNPSDGNTSCGGELAMETGTVSVAFVLIKSYLFQLTYKGQRNSSVGLTKHVMATTWTPVGMINIMRKTCVQTYDDTSDEEAPWLNLTLAPNLVHLKTLIIKTLIIQDDKHIIVCL